MERIESSIQDRKRVVYSDLIETTSLYFSHKEPSFWTKKNPAPTGEEEERISPAANDSVTYLSITSIAKRRLVSGGPH